jgi:hypothetical protein
MATRNFDVLVVQLYGSPAKLTKTTEWREAAERIIIDTTTQIGRASCRERV